jgi:hypothetical protein
MKKGENIVVIIDGDIKGAEVIAVLADGSVETSIKTYDGDNLRVERHKAFTASEWDQIKGEFL